MSAPILDASDHSQLLQRVFDLPRRGMTADLARGLLDLDFPDSDHERIAALNEKANEGTLSESERRELATYCNVANLLAYWQSQARQHLKNGNGGTVRR